MTGKVITSAVGSTVTFRDLAQGMYVVTVSLNGEELQTAKLIVQ